MQRAFTSLQRAYAGAHFGKSLYWYATEMVFAYFLAEQYGFSPALMGGLLLLFLFWDALTDPLIAMAAGGKNASTRRLLRLQLAGALLSGASFCLIFFRPPFEGGALIAYAIVAGLLFRSAYTVLDVPQNTLLVRLGGDTKGVKLLASMRMVCSALAHLAVAGATALAVTGTAGKPDHQLFLLFAFLVAVIGIASAAMLARAGGAIGGEPAEGDRRTAFSGDTRAMRVALARLGPLVPLLGAMFLVSLGWPAFGKLIPYYADYALDRPGFAGTLIAGVALASLAVQPGWAAIMRRLDWHQCYLAAFSVIAAGAGLFAMAGAGSAIGGTLAVLVLAAGASMYTALLWAHLASTLTTPRMAGVDDLLAFGALTLTAKCSLGLGGLVVAGVLEAAGYEQGASMDPASRQLLVALMGASAAGGTLLSMAIVLAGSASSGRKEPQGSVRPYAAD